MLLVWRGWGFLVPVIPVTIWVVLPELLKSVLSEAAYTRSFGFISGASILLGALALWLLGRRLNSDSGRTLVDEKTGERVILRANHSLFFINMEYWAIPLALLALAVLVV